MSGLAYIPMLSPKLPSIHRHIIDQDGLKFSEEEMQMFFERQEGENYHDVKDNERYKKWKQMYKTYPVAPLSKDGSKPSLDDSLLHNSFEHTSEVQEASDNCIVMVANQGRTLESILKFPTPVKSQSCQIQNLDLQLVYSQVVKI